MSRRKRGGFHSISDIFVALAPVASVEEIELESSIELEGDGSSVEDERWILPEEDLSPEAGKVESSTPRRVFARGIRRRRSVAARFDGCVKFRPRSAAR